MSLSAPNIKNEEEISASKVWLTEDTINLELIDGRIIFVPLAFYPTLADASNLNPARNLVKISPSASYKSFPGVVSLKTLKNKEI